MPRPRFQKTVLKSVFTTQETITTSQNVYSIIDESGEHNKDKPKKAYYYLLRSKLSDLLIALNSQQYKTTCNIVFSQFLQHLICYIARHTGINSEIKGLLIQSILDFSKSKGNRLFYKVFVNKVEEVVIWTDLEQKYTVFHAVCRLGSEQIMSKLIQAANLALNPDKDKQCLQDLFIRANQSECSPINIACQSKDVKVIGALAHAVCKEGLENVFNNLFTTANLVFSGNHQQMRNLLMQTNQDGKSLLNVICDISNVKIFIAWSYFVKIVFANYRSVFVALLLPEDKNCISPFRKACYIGNAEFIDSFLDFSRIWVFDNDLEKFLRLLVYQDKDGSSLHMVCQSGESEAVQILFGAFIGYFGMTDGRFRDFLTSKDTQGRTPLYFACRAKSLEAVQALVEKTIDVFKDDNEGFSAFLINEGLLFNCACRAGNINIVEYLLSIAKKYLDETNFQTFLEFKDSDSCTPLNAATICKHEEVSKLLLTYHANPDIPNNQRRSARDNLPHGWGRNFFPQKRSPEDHDHVREETSEELQSSKKRRVGGGSHSAYFSEPQCSAFFKGRALPGVTTPPHQSADPKGCFSVNCKPTPTPNPRWEDKLKGCPPQLPMPFALVFPHKT